MARSFPGDEGGALSPAAKAGLVRRLRRRIAELFREGGGRRRRLWRQRPGEAHVPPGHEKTARFVIGLTTSKAVPEPEFGKA
jgi:hypothetical protein